MGQDITPAVPPKLTQSARSPRTDIRAAEDNGPRPPSAATCGFPLSAALTSPFAGDPLPRSHCPPLAERRFIPVTILVHRFGCMVRIIAPCFRLSSFFFTDLNYFPFPRSKSGKDNRRYPPVRVRTGGLSLHYWDLIQRTLTRPERRSLIPPAYPSAGLKYTLIAVLLSSTRLWET